MCAIAMIEPGWKLLGLLAAADVVALVVLLATSAVGFWRGFIWQIVRLVSVVACMWVALVYHPVVARYVTSRFGESTRVIASVLGVFAATMLVCFLLTYLFRDVINALKPQFTDRILGAAFGALLGGVLVAFVSFVAIEYGSDDTVLTARVQESVGARAMGTCLRYALPDSVRDTVRSARSQRAPRTVSGDRWLRSRPV